MPALWIALGALAGSSGLGLALRWRGRRGSTVVGTEEPASVRTSEEDAVGLRSVALDAVTEAVLITDLDGRVRDCNSAALALFDRHRTAIEEQFASTLRRFEGTDARDPSRVAAERAVWLGEAWARQPDGGMKLCQVRVVAIRDKRSRVTGFVESYRDAVTDRAFSEEFRNLLYGVRAFDAATASPDESLRTIRDELRLLGEAFRDLDLVIRQYERLLPSLAADDPLTETIAGVAHDARSAVAAAGVPGLLEEIPRSLARLRAHLQRLSARPGQQTDGTGATADSDRQTSVPERTLGKGTAG